MQQKKKNGTLLPDFLGIGANRCGSTWLYNNLKRHPAIWIPPGKEIHYFDRSPDYPSPSHLAGDHPLQRLFGFQRHNRQYRKRLMNSLKSNLRKPNRRQFLWDVNYLFGRCNDQWYASLFAAGKDKIKGEITPSYSILEREDVARIKTIMPEVKIILLLRNPVDRVWSAIRKNGLASLPVSDLVKFLNNPSVERRSDYPAIITTWSHFFTDEQFLVRFFDEISSAPEKLLLDIYGFLGIEAQKDALGPAVNRKVNAAPMAEIPLELKKYAYRKYEPMIKKLAEMTGGCARNWLHAQNDQTDIQIEKVSPSRPCSTPPNGVVSGNDDGSVE